MIKQLPNLLTLGNLFCGCLGLVQAFDQHLTEAAYFIWAAALLDFLDGFVARLVGNASPLGKQLDSLADVVSFGVLPAVLLFLLLQERTESSWLPYVAFSIALFSALRLARFNIDTTQSDAFRGLSVPANALFISSLPFILGPNPGWLTSIVDSWEVLIGISIVFSLLLVSPIRLFALKFKDYSWGSNRVKYVFLAISVILLAWLGFNGIPLVVLLYIISSIFENQFTVTENNAVADH
ncbi:MAG: CDP-diacylglycerol--serine O-phosphatidyltransferase [Cyclobacteriaceae bacterium]